MKQITITIPNEKLDATVKHIGKIPFARIISETDSEIDLDRKDREILSMILKGYSLKQISTKHKLNYHRARLKLSNIFDLVNPKQPDELVKYIIAHDLLGLKFKKNAKGPYTKLLDKQKKFLLDVLKGLNHKNTARRLDISQAEANDYKKKVLDKVQKGNPEGIVRYIVRENLLDRKGESKTDKHNKAGLSDREKEVLALLLKGHSNAEIAHKLKLSKRTIEVHRSSILVKTKTKKSIDLMGYAIKHKLIRL